MSGLNCHFVSRFLTTPWEYGNRQLSYFDFDEGVVRSSSSRSLFAVIGANTADVEARLNQVVESPIAAAMARLVDMQVESEELLDFPLFRALSLLLTLQPLRSSGRGEHTQRLEEMIMSTDAELDEFARAAQSMYQLGRITVRNDAPLLYPAAGFFPLVAKRDDNVYGTAIAIPVTVRHVFAAVPRSMDWASSTSQWAANGAGFVANASVGTSSRVAIPPSARSDPQRVETLIRKMRDESQQLIALCQVRNEALDRLNAECGLV